MYVCASQNQAEVAPSQFTDAQKELIANKRVAAEAKKRARNLKSQAASQYSLEINARGAAVAIDHDNTQSLLGACGAAPMTVHASSEGVYTPIAQQGGTGSTTRLKFQFGNLWGSWDLYLYHIRILLSHHVPHH